MVLKCASILESLAAGRQDRTLCFGNKREFARIVDVSVPFWVITALTGILMSRNARYALRQYASDRNRLILTLYMALLVGFGYLVLHTTSRVMELVLAA